MKTSKNYLFLLLFLVIATVPSCTDLDSDFTFDFYPQGFIQDWGPYLTPTVVLTIDCDTNSQDDDLNQYLYVSITCEMLNELDYVNHPPEVCEEITLKDIYGNSHTGLFNSIKQEDKCY